MLALKVAILTVAIFFSPAVKADTLKNFELSYKELGKSWALEDALPVDENGLGTSNGMKYIPKIVSHAEKALDYAYKIDMRELKNETSDEFVEKFQSLYIRGLILYIDGWKNSDPYTTMAGNKKHFQWADYYKRL